MTPDLNSLWLWPIAFWAALLAFYYLYIGAINVWENRKAITKKVLVLSAPLLLVMILADVLMQFTLVWLLFWDRPREAMVTQRLKRYRAMTEPSWRKHWADMICTRGLNPFDPTKKHC